MSHYSEHQAFISSLSPELREAFDVACTEASRIMSPAGLDAYIHGAESLRKLGRGDELVATYLEAMPQLVKECGEDIIADAVTAAMKLSSMTSGEVVSLMIGSLPTAARHLGDAALLRGYLTFIHQQASTAARGLRPLLKHIDELLSKLTLSGLRRWAQFGSQAYRRDFKNLTAYFNLESADSLATLQKERRGVLFVRAQR
ncbi:MAG: VWA domain-containing protein, partial [Thiolinea sp.]